MHARTRSVAVLAILIALAGCVSAPGAPGAPGAGYSADPTVDETTIVSEHEDALAAAGSYTYAVEANATVDGQAAGDSSLTAAVDTDANRSIVRTTSSLGPVETVVSNGTVYQRIGAENPQYRTLDADLSADDVVSTDVGPLVRNHSFTLTDTTTVDGQTVRTYEAHENGSNATLQQDLGEGVIVESVDVTLTVRDDGVVVRHHTAAELAFANEEATGTYDRTVRYAAVGSTDVPAPDWIDEATNATAGDA